MKILKHFSRFYWELINCGILCILLTSCRKEVSTNNPLPPVVRDSADPAQYDAPFSGVPEARDIVMYEINQRAFSEAGTFSGILPRLDSIKALGVNVIWLMPIHPIGVIKSVNSPYFVRNYSEVNPEFGSLEDGTTTIL
jgi:glycosidase